MIILRSSKDMRAWSVAERAAGKTIALVPTMGYLHDGHASLATYARDKGHADRVAMSIFVNPTQFGPNEDFARYPRDFERDKVLAENAGVDALFVPEVDDIYPAGAATYVEVERLGSIMCGVSRPTHFRGVATVVAKLFHIVQPHVAVFGQKDAQQFLILQRMVQDLRMDIQMLMAPIVREKDGLAMSSRNIYLNNDERRQATCLFQSLENARSMIQLGETSVETILSAMHHICSKHSLARIDYLTIRDLNTLDELTTVRRPMLIAMAVYIGKTRLIDNWIDA